MRHHRIRGRLYNPFQIVSKVLLVASFITLMVLAFLNFFMKSESVIYISLYCSLGFIVAGILRIVGMKVMKPRRVGGLRRVGVRSVREESVNPPYAPVDEGDLIVTGDAVE